MELDGSVTVITSGNTGIAIALAERFSALGSIVILSDKNEIELIKSANALGVTGIAADTSCRAGIKNIVDKTIHRFGRIDLFVSNTSPAENEGGTLFAKDHCQCQHSDVMVQMYAAKYVLPQMMRQRNGYLLNMIPSTGLFSEFHSELYSTLKHPSLSFAERIATNYRAAGIKISICSSASLLAFGPDELYVYNNYDHTLTILADKIVAGLQKEQFIILPDSQKCNYNLPGDIMLPLPLFNK